MTMITGARDESALAIDDRIVDTHNDLLMLVVRRPPDRWGSYFRDRWLPQLRAGNVAVQVLAVYVDHATSADNALRETLRMIEAAHVIAEENSESVALCRSLSEVRGAEASGRIALLLAVEGCGSLAPGVELFSLLHRLGVRMVSLVHMGRNAFADASNEDAASVGGLSQLGKTALHVIEDLGMIFDISHLADRGVDDVLGQATMPIIASHSSSRTLRDHHRNLTDDQISAVAAGGGVVCVNFMASFLRKSGATLDDLVDHIEHIRDVAGEDHVGIGPDFVAEVFTEIAPATVGPGFDDFDPIETITELDGPSGFPTLTSRLVTRGWGHEQFAQTYRDNVLRLLKHVCP